MTLYSMRNVYFTLSIFYLSIYFTPAQSQPKTMALNDCMAYAVENSPKVKIQKHNSNNYLQDRNDALASFFPSLEGSIGGQVSFGKVTGMDNVAVDDITQYRNSYSLGSSMPLFTGLSTINTYKAAKTAILLGNQEFNQAKDEVALETMQAYFDVLYYTKSAILASEKLDATNENLRITAKQEELGLKSHAELLEIEAQAASDELLLIQQENLRDIAMIFLKEKMNYPQTEDLHIDKNIENAYLLDDYILSNTISNGLYNNPKMKTAELSLLRNEQLFKSAKGRLLPSLYLSGGYSNNFYHTVHGNNLPYSKQLDLNRSFYVSANLNIPIFSGLSRRTSTNKAKNNVRIAEQNKLSTERALQSEIEQDYLQMKGFEKEFTQAAKKVISAEASHKATTRKYEQGTISAFDLQTSANRLLEAQAQKLYAELQYLIKHRLIEYYNGKPLIR